MGAVLSGKKECWYCGTRALRRVNDRGLWFCGSCGEYFEVSGSEIEAVGHRLHKDPSGLSGSHRQCSSPSSPNSQCSTHSQQTVLCTLCRHNFELSTILLANTTELPAYRSHGGSKEAFLENYSRQVTAKYSTLCDRCVRNVDDELSLQQRLLPLPTSARTATSFPDESSFANRSAKSGAGSECPTAGRAPCVAVGACCWSIATSVCAYGCSNRVLVVAGSTVQADLAVLLCGAVDALVMQQWWPVALGAAMALTRGSVLALCLVAKMAAVCIQAAGGRSEIPTRRSVPPQTLTRQSLLSRQSLHRQSAHRQPIHDRQPQLPKDEATPTRGQPSSQPKAPPPVPPTTAALLSARPEKVQWQPSRFATPSGLEDSFQQLQLDRAPPRSGAVFVASAVCVAVGAIALCILNYRMLIADLE